MPSLSAHHEQGAKREQREALGAVPTWAAASGHPRLAGGAGRPDFPAVAVLRVATGATTRQACTAAGIDPDGDIVGIPAAAF